MAPKRKEKKPKKSSKDFSDASPAKSLAAEISRLQDGLSATLKAYGDKLQSEAAMVRDWAVNLAKSEKPMRREQVRDLGDMIGLLRKLKLKPEKGRRRDLRKVESVLEDLTALTGQRNSAKAEG